MVDETEISVDTSYKQLNKSFADLVSQMELLAGKNAGVVLDAANEAVLFRANPSLAFPLRDVETLEYSQELERFVCEINFIGLYGPTSPLADHYTVSVIDDETGVLRDFLDLFNHRIVSYYYDILRKYSLPFGVAQSRSRLKTYLLSLIGLDDDTPRDFAPAKLATSIGLIRSGGTSASKVEGVLAQYFGVTTSVKPFISEVLTIPGDQLNRLGEHASLGSTAILGHSIRSYDTRFGLRLGPVEQNRLVAFIPNGESHLELVGLVDFLVGHRLAFDIEVEVEAESIIGISLDCERTAILDWSCWLEQPSENVSVSVLN